ncbi:hypothetical protein, partial [Parafrankia sp. FMc2]|uniref:hypothetical protein n=1 Tax=Parafrankia sp. FMc2 TaxID=3233196 RepID=UPI0034D46459
MSMWAEQRRADKAAERDADRADAAAAREQDRLDAATAAKLEEKAAAAADAAKARAREEKAKAKAARSAWRSAHAVELLIYPLALVSAVMAVPAMASYGHSLYDSPTGYALPILSELGMWAFALAVHAARRDDPDRPVATLQAGIVVFALVALGLNVAHGLHDGLSVGLVMGVISVAGVVAHQFAVAAPPRSRAERARIRIERTATRRITRARKLAARTAVVALAADGTARLVYTPGLYEPRGRTLATASGPGLPVTDPWDAALVELTGSDLDSDVPGRPAADLDPISGADLGGSSAVAGSVRAACPGDDRERGSGIVRGRIPPR